MIIRQARADDAVFVADIVNAIIRESLVTFTTEERALAAIAADIDARGPRFLVAESSGRVVGFATYTAFRAGPGYAQTREHSINLTPDARGQGAGRALMTELEKAARRDGVHVLVAGISSANPGAIAFHKALGFTQVGRMPQVGRKWGKWLDLVLMQKILAADQPVAPDRRNLGR